MELNATEEVTTSDGSKTLEKSSGGEEVAGSGSMHLVDLDSQEGFEGTILRDRDPASDLHDASALPVHNGILETIRRRSIHAAFTSHSCRAGHYYDPPR
jgi:hypothetical protein